MLKKIVLSFGIFAFALSAGSVPAKVTSFKVTITQPAMVKGQDLKTGEYNLSLNGEKLTMVRGKQSIEVPVKVETVEQKFDSTAVRYSGTGKMEITEIRVGGTKTRLIFN
jgi:hypothetical protein